MKFQILDPTHPFFKPLWIRILCTVFPLAWAGVEFSNGATGWAMIFVVTGLYAGYELLFMYDHTIRKAEAKAEAERVRIAAEAERPDGE
ncbi:hypothetical protein ACSV9I_10235 [Rhizobium sp. G187]|uniref:hypothetical protein n=1 Tax=Rhizobium sp. G187 TaxID=3451352 RepID=UPI003EE57D1D